MTASKLDYELLDFGDGRKLERFGNIVVDRPEVLATEKKVLSKDIWNKAAGKFNSVRKLKGVWKMRSKVEASWGCSFENNQVSWECLLKLGEYKHMGIFPEQEAHWNYISSKLKSGDKFLNLFGYTGCASLTAAKTGADVFHVDSSKSVVNWASKNAVHSSIKNIHWVCEDALRFAKREVKRGNKYHAIIMDPPVYGRGKKGEHWRLEDLLPELVQTTASLLHKGGIIILNTYSPTVSLPMMENVCKNYDLQCIEKGWLSVNTKDQRSLELSKFIIAQTRA